MAIVIPADYGERIATGRPAVVQVVEDGKFTSYDFDSWTELSQYRDQFTPDYDWVRTVRLQVAVPKIIRLLGYDRLPERHVKLTRRNIFARDRNICQYCGQRFPTSELTIDHVQNFLECMRSRKTPNGDVEYEICGVEHL